MTIGRRLYEERIELRLTEAGFGELCGKSGNVVKAWEADRGAPDAPTLACLCRAGVDVVYVLSGRAGPRNEEESALIADYRACDQVRREKIIKTTVKALADTKKDEFKIDLTDISD